MFSSILLTSVFVSSVLAANDWSTPCLSGVCEYDLPTDNSASGTIKIWSSDASAISDITTAAGWTILGCSADALAQDIRLVCTGGSDCAHLYSDSKTGAVGKIVRLPENCGKSPFAVVTKMYKSPDQSLPASLSRRGAGANTTVQGLSISTSFADANAPSSGPVNFAIRAANVPGAAGNLGTPAQLQSRANSRSFRFARRGFTDFIRGAVDDISSLDDFNINKNISLKPLDLDKSFNLVNQNISCPPVDAGVKIDIDAKAHAVATIGLAASGTILPPKVESFAIIAGLNAEIDGSVTMVADASGTLDSGKIPLFSVGVPGLDFPGILTIGPTFKVDAQAIAKLDVNADVTVGLSYTINNAQLVFPPSSSTKQAKGSFNIGDTPLKISASPSATATGTLEAHLIPSLNLGISALGDIVSANIFLELDASAALALSAQASADANATVGRRALRYQRGLEDFKARHMDDEEDQDNGDADSSDDSTDSADTDTDASADDVDSANAGVEGDDASSHVDATADPSDDESSDSSVDTSTGVDDSDSSTGDASDYAETYPSTPTDSAYDTDDTYTSTSGNDTTADTTPVYSDSDGYSPASDNKVLTAPTNTNTSTSFGGCVEIDATLDVNAGASGSFFGLFDKSTKVDLFNKKFELFKKCFGSEATRRSLPTVARRGLPPFFSHARSLSISRPQRRAFSLQCPSTSEGLDGALQTLLDETVPASSIQ